MKKNKISKNWIIKQHRDPFFKQSKIQGYKSRSGTKAKLHFEGGQTPLARRLPKRGMKIFSKNYRYKTNYQIINLKDLASLKVTKVDSKVLYNKGFIKKVDIPAYLSPFS